VKILLVDIDSKIPNLALMKISAWYKQQGDEVGFVIDNPDKVYISCIFKKNAGQARGVASFYDSAEIDIGGSGVDLKKELPQEIEQIKPDYDIYPSTYSQDYTTRGCVNKCEFCVVPEKEGKIRIAKHPSEFHDSRFDTCMIMDNNLFAAPKSWQWQVFKWFHNTNTKMLSPQGWDARLLNEENCGFLKMVKHAGIIHFAWDNLNDEEKILDAVELLREKKFDLKRGVSFYVLAGFNTKFEDDLYRCEKLKSLGVQAFVMPFHKKDKRINALARWANRPWLYWSIPFSQYRRKH
jgi:hypothetical protein